MIGIYIQEGGINTKREIGDVKGTLNERGEKRVLETASPRGKWLLLTVRGRRRA